MTPVIYYPSDNLWYPSRATDAISCVVTKNKEGDYYLEMEYPVNGAYADRLVCGNYVGARSSRADPEEQRFQIKQVEQDIAGVIRVTAHHSTYNLSAYPVKAFDKSSCTPAQAIKKIMSNAVRDPNTDSLFLTTESVGTAKEFGFDAPVTVREAIYGSGGLIETYGGVIKSNLNGAWWLANDDVGDFKGTIRYGVNLISCVRTFDVSDTYSHAYVYFDTGEERIAVSGLVQLGSDATFTAATLMDLSDEFGEDEVPTTEQLKSKAVEIAVQRQLTSPILTLEIEFVPLRLTDDYKHMTWLEEVDLYDTVRVEVPMFGTTKAMITETQFDVLAENYNAVVVGNTNRTIGRTLAALL